MAKKIRVAILISGRGSNMVKLLEACLEQDFPAQIIVVGSNKSDALGLDYAKSLAVPTFVVDNKKFIHPVNNREEFDKILYQEIAKYDVELICLAGFMRILSPWFINKFHNRILNIHPSLLPNFKGANAVKDAIDAKATISGCTTHFVIPEIDAGPIIMQAQVNIDKDDNYASLAQKILLEEHKIYPATLKLVCNNILNQKI